MRVLRALSSLCNSAQTKLNWIQPKAGAANLKSNTLSPRFLRGTDPRPAYMLRLKGMYRSFGRKRCLLAIAEFADMSCCRVGELVVSSTGQWPSLLCRTAL